VLYPPDLRGTRKCSLLFSLSFVTIIREDGSNSDEFFQSRQIRILSANDLDWVACAASARFTDRFVGESVRRHCLDPHRLQFGVTAAFDQDVPPGNQTDAHLRRERSAITRQFIGPRLRRRNLCKAPRRTGIRQGKISALFDFASLLTQRKVFG